MKTERRIIFRTETVERISLRQTSKKSISQVFTCGVYKIEISTKEQIIFAAEVSGFIEITDNNDEIQININKID
jgi:hypothetical protein